MMTKGISAALVALAVLGVVPAWARDLHASGPSGRPIRVAVEGAWNKSCLPKAFPSFQTTQPPAHGSVSLQPETFTIRHSLSGDTTCIGRPGSGQALYYTSEPGFHGTDRLASIVTFPDGATLDLTATITVR